MDTTDPSIQFDENGFCSHCTNYLIKVRLQTADEYGQKALQKIVQAIQAEGANKRYDCVIGVSGGVDSTYVAYIVKHQFGLRPLAVHLDNGWNSELSVNNIEKTLRSLDIDLYTYVINWEEFKDLQLSFLLASIPGMEIPTDHAILSILYRVAAKHNIRYIISGANISTEGIMAASWSEGVGQRDWRLIKKIHAQFGKVPLKTFPHFTLISMIYYRLIQRQQTIHILDYLSYVKKDAMDIIQKNLDWKYYGGKHYESLYTRFTQGYIQPLKFNIDKRKAHLSTLICSGQITRTEAIEELSTDPYKDIRLREEDKAYVIKKLGLTEQKFEQIMKAPPKNYLDYPSYANHLIFSRVLKCALNLHFRLKRRGFYG